MKYFVDILKQFNSTQRLVVLILLLSFTTGTYLTSQYLKTDDCRVLIDENLKMHEDFAKISSMLRKKSMDENMVDSTMAMSGSKDGPPPAESIPGEEIVMNEVLKIAESHTK